MDLEGIILREISQTEKENTIGSHWYVESKDEAKWKQTHRLKKENLSFLELPDIQKSRKEEEYVYMHIRTSQAAQW